MAQYQPKPDERRPHLASAMRPRAATCTAFAAGMVARFSIMLRRACFSRQGDWVGSFARPTIASSGCCLPFCQPTRMSPCVGAFDARRCRDARVLLRAPGVADDRRVWRHSPQRSLVAVTSPTTGCQAQWRHASSRARRGGMLARSA